MMAKEALDYLLRRGRYGSPADSPRPDLVLLDLNLPKVSGCGVLLAMQADPVLARVPVVILTTSDQEQDIANTYSLGCNSYITKPAIVEQFQRVVESLNRYWFVVVCLPTHAD